MLTIAVELLSGRYIATAYNDRAEVEWPPHPARFFSALAATWADQECCEHERAFLEWLERQEPPEIFAAPLEIGKRTSVPVFVPVNDVYQVSAPARDKLDEALVRWQEAGDEKSRLRAQKEVEKLQSKYAEGCAQAMAVPVKFGKDSRQGLQLLPEYRGRQERKFPSATPEREVFVFHWPQAELPAQWASVVDGLLSRVVRLGHSSSFVRPFRLPSGPSEVFVQGLVHFRPDPVEGLETLRWVGEGQLRRLEKAFEFHRETESRILPARFVTYRREQGKVGEVVGSSLFSEEFLVFERVEGPRLPITSCVGLAKQFRRALQSVADEPIPEFLSGHTPQGSPGQQFHLAVVPLPWIGGAYADGSLMGLALIRPRELPAEDWRAVLRAIGRLERAGKGDHIDLKLSARTAWRLKRLLWGKSPRTLEARRWARPSRLWGSVTPVALDRNPGDLHSENASKRSAAFAEARDTVLQAVRRIGLPEPRELDVLRSCCVAGTVKPQDFPRYPFQASRPQRVLVHVRLEFDHPVRGPILLGAGRYHGLGLMVPISEGGQPQ